MDNTLYIGDEERKLPTKWCICRQCKGDGKSSAYLGAYTHEEMEQQGEQFIEDYFGGRFDRICESCKGAGKVQEVDLSQLTTTDKAAWYKQCEADRLDRAIHAAEIRAGA